MQAGRLDIFPDLGNAAQALASDCATESRHAVTGGVTTLLPFVITRGSYLDALGEMRRMTYRIPQRTVDLIEELAQTSYNNDRAQVFAAGIKAIKMKKIK